MKFCDYLATIEERPDLGFHDAKHEACKIMQTYLDENREEYLEIEPFPCWKRSDTAVAYVLDALLGERVPQVENIDAQILNAIRENGRHSFDMNHWHVTSQRAKCGTAHCRAGWATTLAPGGLLFEQGMTSAAMAGALIYLRSTGRVPDFYTDDKTAMDDMERGAQEGGA